MLSSATTSSEDDTAKHVEVAGLVMQLFFEFTFVGICLYVWTQVKAHAPADTEGSHSLLLVSVRTHRPTGHAQCLPHSRVRLRHLHYRYLQQNEAWYLIWDPTLMTIALAVAFLFDFTKRIPADALNPPSSPAAVSDSDMEMGHVTKSDATVLQVISPSSGSAEMA